jgi:hypothetical protein
MREASRHFRLVQKVLGFGHKLDILQTQRASHRDGTIDAPSPIQAWKRRKRVVVTGALVQMFTFGLILVGAAVVLFGSIFNPRQADPMGMFGLPPVSAIACAVNVKSRARRSNEIVSRPGNREAA